MRTRNDAAKVTKRSTARRSGTRRGPTTRKIERRAETKREGLSEGQARWRRASMSQSNPQGEVLTDGETPKGRGDPWREWSDHQPRSDEMSRTVTGTARG